MSASADLAVDDKEQDSVLQCLASRLTRATPLPTPPADLDWERLARVLIWSHLSSHFFILGKKQHELWDADILAFYTKI